MPVTRFFLCLLLGLRSLLPRPPDHYRLFPHRPVVLLLYRPGSLFHRLPRLRPLNGFLLKPAVLLLYGYWPLLYRLPRLLLLNRLLLKPAGLLLLPDRYGWLLLLLPLQGSLPELPRGKPVCRNVSRPVIPLVVHHLGILI